MSSGREERNFTSESERSDISRKSLLSLISAEVDLAHSDSQIAGVL